jgi:hypothetical protein
MKKKVQVPLPNYRKAGLSPTQQDTDTATDHFVAVCRRQDEIARMSELFNQLKPPTSIDGKKLIDWELQAYSLAVNFARGTALKPDEFLKLTETMAKRANVRFFQICAAAMQSVKIEREHQYSVTDGHRMAALQAKLELERNTGKLPTQKQVKMRAFALVKLFIKSRNQDFAPYEPANKRWSKILKSAGLDYLQVGVRGR